MKIPPWLKMRSTGAEVAGTQYIELRIGRRHLNLSLLITVFTLALGSQMLPRCMPVAYNAGSLAGQPKLKR